MLRECGRAIKLAAVGESRLDRRAVTKSCQKGPRRLRQAFDLNAGRPALDQKVSRATAEIDLAERIIIGIYNRPPYDVSGIFQPQQPDRRIGIEADPRLVFSRDRAELRDIQRRDIRSVQRAVHGPFQFSDISEIAD